jgi:DNA-binding transcriptional LysR family regulator
MRYTLRQLEVFLAVARAGSVTAAPAALAMSQSAASGALADLESAFDAPLFDRRGKRLALNARGQAVRAQAESVWSQASELERSLAGRHGEARLRIGATMTIGNYLVVPLMARFLRERPGADLSLAVGNTEEIARQVANFEIDVGLIEGEVDAAGLEVIGWRDDELTVFTGPEHPLARKRALSDNDLRRAAWIVRERGSGTRQAFDRAMRGLLPDLRIALTLQHAEAIKAAVAAGIGLGCLSRIALHDAFSHGTLHPCRVPHRDFRRQFYFLLPADKPRGAAHATLDAWLDLCRPTPAHD